MKKVFVIEKENSRFNKMNNKIMFCLTKLIIN